MKKRFVFALLFVLFGFSGIYAEACDLGVSMINQDPYPAIPGDYVKIVFQVDGIANPECGDVEFELLEKYPISFDPGENPIITFTSGFYKKDYSSFLTAPYKVRIDEDALNGDNPIEVQFRQGRNQGYLTKQFNLNIKDTRADFEIHVKSYDYKTNTITFEILNIGENDIEALTLQIPKQNNIEIKGPYTNIVGDLDSNEYTTAEFEAVPSNGEIEIIVTYTDETNLRRTLEKSVEFDSSYFYNRKADQSATSKWTYAFWLTIILGVGYYIYKRKKHNKK